MSEQHSLQRVQKNGSAGAIMTSQGPAVIQIIDMAGGGAMAPYSAGPSPKKAGGINIFRAIGRRWWLVAIVTLMVGGAAFFAASNFVKPMYEAVVIVSVHDPDAVGSARGPVSDVAKRALRLLKTQVALIAIRDPQIQALFPDVVQGKNINDPLVQLAVLDIFRDAVDSDQWLDADAISLFADQPTEEAAKKVANAIGAAFVEYCQKAIGSQGEADKKVAQDQMEQDTFRVESLQKAIADLKQKFDFEKDLAVRTANVALIAKLEDDKTKAEVDCAAAEAHLKAVRDPTGAMVRRPDQELEALALREQEEAKDSPLKAYEAALLKAMGDLSDLQGQGMKDEHPSVITARAQVARAKESVVQRKLEIAAAINKRIDEKFHWMDATDVQKTKETYEKTRDQIAVLERQLEKLGEESRKTATARAQLDQLNDNLAAATDRKKKESDLYYELEQKQLTAPHRGLFKLEQQATFAKAKVDQRIKVQAGGLVGGLFLGILLALLIDRFDKRLREPGELEPMLNAPLLGTIPRIQELKRVKGEQARNLIAEEFRIIRTQVLFGNPDLQYKLMAITSPSPGDGKTSLAVNLAISIAKAGRRVLLIDADLRKPDIHRVFNIPDSPGFSEVIAGSNEPGAVIRKSDIDGLDIMAAGTPITRPSELLSRPDVSRVLAALGELYDHVILDTAPVLPVSDTHVLVGMMDAVIVSFNASVERDIVTQTQQILYRSRANVIGSVMNQVPYKQTSTYQRGKTAYDSYYNSPRGASPTRSSKSDGAMATVNRG